MPTSFFLRARQFVRTHNLLRPVSEFFEACSLSFRKGSRFVGKYPRLRYAIAFALACFMTWGLEQWRDYEVEGNGEGSIITQPISGAATFYHHLVTAGPRKLKPSFTVLVEISRRTTPRGLDLTNTCAQRRYLGELLKGLALTHPNVVVIDKFFGMGCPAEDPGTRNLVAGFAKLCEDRARVVVGRAIEEDSRNRGSPPYRLEEAFDFRAAGAGCVNEGVVNFDSDPRRASLWFPDVQPVAYSNAPAPSLTLAAALAHKPDLKIANWPSTSPSPYVGFLESGQFDSVTLQASDVVCGTRDDWRACRENEIPPYVRALTRGKVVVIGEDYPGIDRHTTVVGDVAGYVLQANYIESILDDRLIRPVPELLDWAAGLMIFVCFEYLFSRYYGIRKLTRLALLFAATALAVYLTVTLLGYYLNPTTISILAVLNSRVIEFFLV